MKCYSLHPVFHLRESCSSAVIIFFPFADRQVRTPANNVRRSRPSEMKPQVKPHVPVALGSATLAGRLGTTTHISPLLMKARRMGLKQPDDFEKLAISRGLRYYDSRSGSTKPLPTLSESPHGTIECALTNEELAIALLSPVSPYSLQRLRMGAAMLAADGNRPEHIARLARRERSESVVRHIGQCGIETEPDNPFWSTLLDLLPITPPPQPDKLPHLTRFVAMTGLLRSGRGFSMQWIRPTRLPHS